MIPRYSPTLMAEVWSDENKLGTWLKVELAVVQARAKLNRIEQSIADHISANAHFTVAAIEERESVIEHDLQAFVDVVRDSLGLGLRKFFHQDLTSYDTEVPAQAIQMMQAIEIIRTDLAKFIEALRLKASEHAWTFCMGITHGQDAEPTTFGWRLAGYLEMLEKVDLDLVAISQQVEQIKCSGAVGNYLTIDPELEAKVAEILEFDVRPAATQIVGRDVHARLLSALAILGGCIEKMATDLRLLATSAYAEIREPRKTKQKGSSAMPHKRNPILLERMCGMSIALRGYAVMGQELIRTWLERDIAHSSVERIALPDACCLADYMLQKMTGIISRLEIDRDRMAENIDRIHGCWASENVKTLLHNRGIDPDVVYEFVRDCAFKAMDSHRPFDVVLWDSDINSTPFSQVVTTDELLTCFNFKSKLEARLPIAYQRMNIDLSLALPSNI